MNSSKRIYDYVVVLKNNHKKNIEKTGWLFAILSLILQAISIYYSPTQFTPYFFLIISLLLIFSIALDATKKRQIRFGLMLVIAGIGIIICAILPLAIGLLLILAGLSEKHLLLNREIGFSEKEIKENGLFGKTIQWKELNQVLIKDDILTIDFKNNKLIQQYTDDEEDEDYEAGEEEFNAYCRNRIGFKE